jgi:hypothetical protein
MVFRHERDNPAGLEHGYVQRGGTVAATDVGPRRRILTRRASEGFLSIAPRLARRVST